MKRYEARVNVTWKGRNGDLHDPVAYDATDRDIKEWVYEAIQSGSVDGIPRDRRAQLQNFVVDRFPASNQNPYNRIFVRPKTPFG